MKLTNPSILFWLAAALVPSSVTATAICQIEKSNVLEYNDTSWNKWSCPPDTVIVEGSVAAYGGSGFVADEDHVAKWDFSASIDDGTGTDTVISYPATPWGYTFTRPEEGYIAQASASGDAIITMTCCPSTCSRFQGSSDGWVGVQCNVDEVVAGVSVASTDGSGMANEGNVAMKWKLGASIDDGNGTVCSYPNTPYDFIFTPPKEGYIAQATESGIVSITMACCPYVGMYCSTALSESKLHAHSKANST
jgi:hypothetical protein